MPIRTPPLNPHVADIAPGPGLTPYDEDHFMTYLRLLDWREIARVVLHLDPEHESDRVRRAFENHLSRAKWMMEHGYHHLLRGGASAYRDAANSTGSSLRAEDILWESCVRAVAVSTQRWLFRTGSIWAGPFFRQISVTILFMFRN
jgi:hypothetical protein